MTAAFEHTETNIENRKVKFLNENLFMALYSFNQIFNMVYSIMHSNFCEYVLPKIFLFLIFFLLATFQLKNSSNNVISTTRFYHPKNENSNIYVFLKDLAAVTKRNQYCYQKKWQNHQKFACISKYLILNFSCPQKTYDGQITLPPWIVLDLKKPGCNSVKS